MGREIRRVPPNWKHPEKAVADHRLQRMVRRPQPMFDRPFGPAMREWIADWEAWERGERPSYCTSDEDRASTYWEWAGGPPDPLYYRPDWKPEEMPWFQLYETVSEGTPVSPPFATKEELAAYLAENGDFWDQQRAAEGTIQSAPWGMEAAARFCGSGWAPSFVMQGGKMYSARDGGLPTETGDRP